MAMKFDCQHCGQPIVTQFLKVGEQAQCRACGRHGAVLDTAVEASEEEASQYRTVPKVTASLAYPVASGQEKLALQSMSPGHRPREIRFLVDRYEDGYRVATFMVGLGGTVKIAGGILAGLLAFAGLNFGGGSAVIGGLVLAAVVGGFFFLCGVIVSAQGQLLRASFDTAVSNSPFLSNHERAQAMGLPSIFGDLSAQQAAGAEGKERG